MAWVAVMTLGVQTLLTRGLNNIAYSQKAASAAFFVPLFS